MERRISLFVSKRSPITWIAAVCVLLSAVSRIVLGAMGLITVSNAWTMTVLPIAAIILYVLIALVWGREMFYKTAIPVWMTALFYGIRVTDYGFSNMIQILFWVALLFYAAVYTDITAGRAAGCSGCCC